MSLHAIGCWSKENYVVLANSLRRLGDPHCKPNCKGAEAQIGVPNCNFLLLMMVMQQCKSVRLQISDDKVIEKNAVHYSIEVTPFNAEPVLVQPDHNLLKAYIAEADGDGILHQLIAHGL